MGLGDQLIATGIAKGHSERKQRVAFGSMRKLRWDHNSEQIFRYNPNIAHPGQERQPGVRWVSYYKGHRGYNSQGDERWIWNMEWRCIPGEIYLTDEEKADGKRAGRNFILIEPNVENWKKVAPNKDWGFSNYQQVANKLIEKGHRLIQFSYDKSQGALAGVEQIRTKSFRDALALMSSAAIYLGPEGGLHHGAAAVGKPAVVLFGGFIPPKVTGYDSHANLAGSDHFCGSFNKCDHCIQAMKNISVETVFERAMEKLSG